jgi:hypothetical protein
MKNFSAKRYGSLALALAAFAVAGTAPVFAQSSGAWSAGISGRSGTRADSTTVPTFLLNEPDQLAAAIKAK